MRTRCFVMGSTFAAVAMVTTAQAQVVEPSAKSAGELEEIIVTAQKREENLTRVPAAVTAIGQSVLDNTGTTTIAQATSTVPNLTTAAGRGLSIRGIGSNTLTGASATVAFHIDGIYQASLNAANATQLWDVERIEVLRGPQGTLYGRNATAGVVNVVTARPKPEFEAFGDVAFGNQGEQTVRAVLNVPLGELFAMRFAGTIERNDGRQKNLEGNKNLGTKNHHDARVALSWAPLDQLTWNVNFNYSRDRSVAGNEPATYYASFPNAPVNTGAIVYPSGYPGDVAFIQPGAAAFGSAVDRNRGHVDTLAARSNLRYDLTDSLALTYLFGYSVTDDRGNNASLPITSLTLNERVRDLSHELDLNFEGERVHGVLGLYHFRSTEVGNIYEHIWQPTLSTSSASPPTLAGVLDLNDQILTRSITKAVFGQATFSVTDAFRVTGGLRYNEDQIRWPSIESTHCLFGQLTDPSDTVGGDPVPANTFFPGQPAFSSTCEAVGALFAPGAIYERKPLPFAAKKFHQLSWKATAEYDVARDILLYSTVATGYKAGGVGDRNLSGDDRFFQPEKDINYEIGMRSRLFDNRVMLNVTGFWTDYKDLQVMTIKQVNGAPTTQLVNAGRARSRGLELEGTWALSQHDVVQGYATYLDAKFREFSTTDDFLTAPGSSPTSFNAAGNHLANSPETSFRLSYAHTFDLGAAGTLKPTLQTYHQSSSYAYFTNGPQDHVDAYWRSDAILRYETVGQHFSVEGFVNNIEDKLPVYSAFPQNGMMFTQYGTGRTYGVRFGAKL